MLGKSKGDSSATNTIIGDGVTLEGAKITGKGSIRVDGSLIGEIDIDGNVIVGETGQVQGNIRVNHALIAGKVMGNVVCSDGIHLTGSARLNGNIDASSLIIDDGASFNGASSMGPRSNDPQEREKDRRERQRSRVESFLAGQDEE